MTERLNTEAAAAELESLGKRLSSLTANPRTAMVIEKLLDAMRAMTKEIQANGGIYPNNGGRVSARQVYDRADVHPTTVNAGAKKGNEAYVKLLSGVESWKDCLAKATVPTTKAAVRLTQQQRLEGWKELAEDAAQAQAIIEAEMQTLRSQLEKAKVELEQSEARNEALRIALQAAEGSKVTTLPTAPR